MAKQAADSAHVRRPLFPNVTVILGDPHLPDKTKMENRFGATDFAAIAQLKAALQEHTDYQFTYLDNHASLLADLIANPPAFVFNLCDTGYKNEALYELHLPALLEMLEIPYSGAGPTCLGLCYDKALVRAVASAHGVPVPQETFVGTNTPLSSVAPVFPALLKPNCSDGSVGISRDAVVYSAVEASVYLARLRAEFPDRDVLIQEFLSGAEYSIGVIGNPGMGFIELPPLEVDYRELNSPLPRILPHESKSDPDSPYWTHIKYREARIDNHVRQRLIGNSMLLFQRLGCRDYARFDFRADAKGDIKLLEINPNPAWCWDGKLNLMAGFAGYSYSEFLRLILAAAQSRVAAMDLAESMVNSISAVTRTR